MFKIIVLALILSVLPVLVQAEEPLPFETATVVLQDVPKIEVMNGTVEAVSKTTVSAQTSGNVAEILYDVDDYVEQGAVIIRLQSKEQTASLKETEANLTEAQARVTRAQQEFDRIKDIYERKLVAKSKLDDASAELKAARARLAAVRAAMTKASEQLDYTQVRAPYSGIVTERHVELGEYVTAGKPLMTGLSLDRLRVNVDVPQHLINKIRQEKEATLLPSDSHATVVAVKDLTFFPYADPKTRTFKVRVNLEEKVQGLFPGMFVKVGFVTGKQSRLVVPTAAVAWRGEVTGVYVLDSEGKPALRQVRLGTTTNEGKIVVLAGLFEGDEIAVDPVAAAIYLKQSAEKAHE